MSYSRPVKLIYNVKRHEYAASPNVSNHAELMGPKYKFDDYVRALYWPEKKVIYFRWSNADGEYIREPERENESYNRCDTALEFFIRAKAVPKRVKVLFWQLGHGITEYDIKV